MNPINEAFANMGGDGGEGGTGMTPTESKTELLAKVRELRRLEDAATSGPWTWSDADNDDEEAPYVPQGSYLGGTLITLGDTYENSREDCALAAALRNFCPMLLSELERRLVSEIEREEKMGPAIEKLNDACREYLEQKGESE